MGDRGKLSICVDSFVTGLLLSSLTPHKRYSSPDFVIITRNSVHLKSEPCFSLLETNILLMSLLELMLALSGDGVGGKGEGASKGQDQGCED